MIILDLRGLISWRQRLTGYVLRFPRCRPNWSSYMDYCTVLFEIEGDYDLVYRRSTGPTNTPLYGGYPGRRRDLCGPHILTMLGLQGTMVLLWRSSRQEEYLFCRPWWSFPLPSFPSAATYTDCGTTQQI